MRNKNLPDRREPYSEPPILAKNSRSAPYSHSIVPGGFDVMS
jgi:hypothetical protein